VARTRKETGSTPLEEYVRKRSFDKTPEPAPKAVRPSPAEGAFFCVQRHDATRLHYDFRLEMDGVLKSWAVPKGPSLEPLSKHLAMHVEDHPLEYGNFEGNIPKGEYGGGSVMLWDRGTFDLLGDVSGADQIARGDLKFRLHGEKLSGEFALVLMRGRGKGNEWLLIKKKDESAQPGYNVEDHARSVLTGRSQEEIARELPPLKVADAPAAPAKRSKKNSRREALTALSGAQRSPMPQSVAPMMGSLVDRPPSGDEWLYEIKWDGVRALCFIENQQVRIFSRSGHRCEQQYPEMSVLPHYVDAETVILDGEIAVLDEKGRSSFNMIQPRISVSDPNTIAHLARSTPATIFLFDVLYLDGYDLRGVPLEQRKSLLKEILEPTDQIRYSDHFIANGEAMLEAARQNGLEGILAKRRDSKYEGRRSHSWLKIKATSQQEFVIGGFTHGEREHFSSLVLGLYQGDKLTHAGQVGTGFNDKSLKEIYARLQPLITSKNPFTGAVKMPREVTWVKPELVCEIKYLEFTPDGLLRAPVFLGLRTDKQAREVVRETPEPAAQAELEAVEEQAPVRKTAGLLIPKNSTNDLMLAIEGRSLKFTNLNKNFYPGEGVNKRDLINYYDAVAHLILPHLRDRPLSLKRYPNGINEQYFFQKNAEHKFAEWIRLEPIYSEHAEGETHYVICNDRPTLLYLANLACIDHNPWMSRIGTLENPDFALIDLDPTEGCPYDQIVAAAQIVHKKLEAIGMSGYPKTTGGDGMHVYIPLEPVYTYEQVRSFAEILSLLVIGEDSDLFTTPRAVTKRKKGKVYFDYLQISSSKTIAAPYVLRAYPGAPVSTPLAWSEVKKGLKPTDFNIHNAVQRFERVGDLFEPVLTKKQKLEHALEKLGQLLAVKQ
jgi:bifunctional non-homologous end joining protein LigD